MKTNTEIKDENQTKKPTVSGHVEPVVMWIDVKDREPQGVSNNYLVFRPSAPTNTVCTLWYDPHHNGWSGKYKVTHWAALPKPPQFS